MSNELTDYLYHLPPCTPVDIGYVRFLMGRGATPTIPTMFTILLADHDSTRDVLELVFDYVPPDSLPKYIEACLLRFLVVHKPEIIGMLIARCRNGKDIACMRHLWNFAFESPDIDEDALRYFLFHPVVYNAIDPDVPLNDEGLSIRKVSIERPLLGHSVFHEFLFDKDAPRRARERLDTYKEELIKVTWHPTRMVAWCFHDFLLP